MMMLVILVISGGRHMAISKEFAPHERLSEPAFRFCGWLNLIEHMCAIKTLTQSVGQAVAPTL